MSVSLIAHRCRTSDRTPGAARGVEELAPLVGQRLGCEAREIGTPSEPHVADWREDLASSRGCLLEAGGQVEDALSGRNAPVLLAGECSIAVTTLSAALGQRRDAKVLWLDAHGDFNTPRTSGSGYLGGMALAAACGLWDAGLADPIDPSRVVLAGVRDLDPPERELLEATPVTVIGTSLETLVYTQNALDRAPVFVHVDLDVIDPEHFPTTQVPAPDGLAPDKVYDLLEAVAGECEVIGFEVTAFDAPEDELERRNAASVAVHVLDPLLAAVRREAHVSN
ncbi:MAG TPA: arginase family protein [Thermoleophilaceae bacterium]|nr:arginase family protein [Thermoleophilaceae bacterium]